MNFLVEGIDRLGKDTLINNIQQKLGYYQVLHRSKPLNLQYYVSLQSTDSRSKSIDISQLLYQEACFSQDMNLLSVAEKNSLRLIFNRTWLGEYIYALLYRNYSGSYVFNLEKQFDVDKLSNTRLILLTENFDKSAHFVSDGDSFDDSKRKCEQNLFIDAFNKSIIKDKRIINVTTETGTFKSENDILREALE